MKWCALCHAPWPVGAEACPNPTCGSDFPTAVRWSYLPSALLSREERAARTAPARRATRRR